MMSSRPINVTPKGHHCVVKTSLVQAQHDFKNTCKVRLNEIAKSNLETGRIATPRGRPTHAVAHNRSILIATWHQCAPFSINDSLDLYPTIVSNGFSIQSAVFSQYTFVTNGHRTGRLTDRTDTELAAATRPIMKDRPIGHR